MATRLCRGLVVAATSIGKSLRILCMIIFITILPKILVMLIGLFLGVVTKIMIMPTIAVLHVLVNILLMLRVRIRMVKAVFMMPLLTKSPVKNTIFRGDANVGHTKVV